MITMKELNPRGHKTDVETASNLSRLLKALNVVRKAYGKAMIVTSGLRSQADQTRINPSAPKSKHLLGLAVDIKDVDGSFWKWCMVNMDLMVELGFYFEDKSATPTWVHMQLVPPKSGKRIFLP
jgi:uncharacterized protein YcbK (DUF882 family)